ncbi:unnamed protein product, partial [Amoebophrya sp. A120]
SSSSESRDVVPRALRRVEVVFFPSKTSKFSSSFTFSSSPTSSSSSITLP